MQSVNSTNSVNKIGVYGSLTTILMQDTGEKPSTAVVDLGYRGVDRDNPGLTIIHRG